MYLIMRRAHNVYDRREYSMSDEMIPDSVNNPSKKTVSEVLDIAITVLSLVMDLYHLVYAYALFINVYMHQNMHLMIYLHLKSFFYVLYEFLSSRL